MNNKRIFFAHCHGRDATLPVRFPLLLAHREIREPQHQHGGLLRPTVLVVVVIVMMHFENLAMNFFNPYSRKVLPTF